MRASRGCLGECGHLREIAQWHVEKGTSLFVESKFSEIGVRLVYGLELNNNQVIKAVVEENLGIAILSSRTVEAEVASARSTLPPRPSGPFFCFLLLPNLEPQE